jgi:acetoin utilization deacetylase AcuC-like enzyme
VGKEGGLLAGLGWVYDRRFLLHATSATHVERPERLQVIRAAVEEAGLLPYLRPIAIRHASPDELSLVHDPAYVALVRMACDEGFGFIGSPETELCRWSYDTAALAVGAVLRACDAVVAGRVARAFCATRPPGHHAERDRALGFCLFNNAATAAEHLIRNCGLARVAIVDFDVHHGNGTQQIFASRGDVLYISLHERPESLAFPGSGTAAEKGSGEGRGLTVNLPLSRGCRTAAYLEVVNGEVVAALDAFRPEFLLLSAGFDALSSDRVANLSLEPDAFREITRPLVGIAQRHAAGRIVSVLEGGYDLSDLGPAVVAHLRALLPP